MSPRSWISGTLRTAGSRYLGRRNSRDASWNRDRNPKTHPEAGKRQPSELQTSRMTTKEILLEVAEKLPPDA